MSVFANGRGLAGKVGGGQVIAAFPDVCLSPPSPPSGPIPIPYPVTSVDADTSGGSKSVKSEKKPVMLRDSSTFKKCVGDEPATKSLGMSVITHALGGKVYFNAWSMDVKIEGKNAVRALDLTTSNHQSQPGSTPPWPFQKEMEVDEAGNTKDPCASEKQKLDSACGERKTKKERCAGSETAPKRPDVKVPKKEAELAAFLRTDEGKKYTAWKDKTEAFHKNRAQKNAEDPCARAMKCQLQKWQPSGCCPGMTPHHLIEKTSFFEGAVKDGKKLTGCSRYDPKSAPCICVEGTSWFLGSHAWMHTAQGYKMEKLTATRSEPKKVTFGEAKKNAAQSVRAVFPEANCSAACIEAQLKNGHKGVSEDREIHASPCGYTSEQDYKNMRGEVGEKTGRIKGLGTGTRPALG